MIQCSHSKNKCFLELNKEEVMNAVLLGYGTVGKGVEILCRNVEGLNLKQVFVLPELEDLPYFSNDGKGMVTRDDIDIVFECLSGTEPSNTLITLALEHGKHVITSNKATVSPNLERYVEIAKKTGGSIQIEASVAGGIPFLDAILKLQKLEEIRGYQGIFNGTSNYILDQMQKNGMELDVALKQAQAMGYAEADPTNDIEGIDVYYKTNITNMLAYNTKNDKIRKPIGITRLNTGDIELAKEHKKVIRHLSISKQKEGHFASIIAPAFLSQSHYLANVPDNYNAQLIFADSFDYLGYFGQGAGQLATAQAMLANAIDTMENRERKIDLQFHKTVDESLLKVNWIVRCKKGLEKADRTQAIDENTSYYWFEQKDASIIDTILDHDKEAMIALWM